MDLQMKEKKHARVVLWGCASIFFLVPVVLLSIIYGKVSPEFIGYIFGLVIISAGMVNLFLWRSKQPWGNVKVVTVFVFILICVAALCLRGNGGKYIAGGPHATFYAINNVASANSKYISMQSITVIPDSTWEECENALKGIKEGFNGTDKNHSMQIISSKCQLEKTENMSNLEEWIPFMHAYVLKTTSTSKETTYTILYNSSVREEGKCEIITSAFAKSAPKYKIECLPPKIN